MLYYKHREKETSKLKIQKEGFIMKAIRILGFEPVNPAWDIEKVNKIKANIKQHGWQGCPILTYGPHRGKTN